MASVATTSDRAAQADPTLDELLAPVLEAVHERHRRGRGRRASIVEAARAAELAHRGQIRRSGEPYVTHPVAVALTVAELGLDAATVAAALLHDAVEDTGMSLEHVAGRVRRGRSPASSTASPSSTASSSTPRRPSRPPRSARCSSPWPTDWRVLLIKLADRLHNMRTIAVMPEVSQRATAQETLDVYAPLAHRLGVQQVKWQLEDLALRDAAPEALRRDRADGRVARRPSARSYLARGHRPCCASARRARHRRRASPGARSTSGASTRRWSSNGKEFDDIFDLVGLRVDRRRGAGLLGGARRASTPCGTRSRDASRTTSTRRSSTCTSRCTRRSSARTASPSRCRSGPRRCTAAPSTASPRTGATRRTPRRPRSPGCSGSPTSSRRPTDPDRVPRGAQARPRAGRGLRLHAQGPGDRARRPARPRSTSPTPCTPRSGTTASAPR